MISDPQQAVDGKAAAGCSSPGGEHRNDHFAGVADHCVEYTSAMMSGHCVVNEKMSVGED
jgi:hypothetical protein